jgi:PAS domain S-box-containing protein
MKKSFSKLAFQHLGAPAILNAMGVGIYVTDTSRNILFWNKAAERITGWSASEVVGRSCYDNILIHIDKDGHKLCGEEYCPLHRCIITGQASDQPLLVYAQNRAGVRVPVEVSVSPILDNSGRVLGGIEIFRDLTSGFEDLVRAKIIQNSALKAEIPSDPHVSFDVRYTPSEVVGGDFYRIERIADNLYGILIADVMGHGVAAALYTMQLRSLWEDWRGKLVSPAGFIQQINKSLLILSVGAGYFATAIYGIFNPETGCFRYIRAGHPAPLILFADGKSQPQGETQPALGLLDSFTYTEETLTLNTGDRLLMYTDGAIEVMNAQGEELGEDGLVRLLTTHGPLSVAELEEKILSYSADIHLPDDLTLLCISRPG